MRSSIKLGKIFGIEVGLHYTWFIIAVFIAIALVNLFGVSRPEWSIATVWSVSLATTVCFFITLLIHELSHCLVARGFGIPVASITLFALGGVSNIEKEASSATAEFWMGVVGPITSLMIGFLCELGAVELGWRMNEPAAVYPIAAGLAWLGRINVLLGIFNLIPGFPLDGGRVLKAVIWWITKNADRSALIASYVGEVIAMLFMIGGFLSVFASGSFAGIWLIAIGWFLSIGAGGAIQQTRLRASLKNVRAEDAMSRQWPAISADTPLDEFVKTQLAVSGYRYFFVHEPADSDAVVGLVTPHEVAKLSHEEWHRKVVADVMLPMESLQTTSPGAPVIDALDTMLRQHVEQLPVVDHRKLVGILTRSNVIELFETRSELGLGAA